MAEFEKVDPKELQELQASFDPNTNEPDVIDLDAPKVEAQVESETTEEGESEIPDNSVKPYTENEVDPTSDTKSKSTVKNDTFEKIVEEIPVEESADDTTGEIEPIPISEKVKLDQPEGVEKLVEFMHETGGTMEDYLHLNRDVSKMSEEDQLAEYYKNKEGWDRQETLDYIEDTFSYDEHLDEPKEVRSRQREHKKELRNAKSFISERKDKYYQELVSNRVSLPKADKEAHQQRIQEFQEGTNEVFGEDFKGFAIDLGDEIGPVLYKVGDVDKVKETHLNPDNALSEFIKDGVVVDHKGYHKSMYFAKNGETIARRMYEQGKADAIAERSRESKNIDLTGNDAPSASSNSNKSGQYEKVDHNSSSSQLRVNQKWMKSRS